MILNAVLCGENARPCMYCGYFDCEDSEKCKWSINKKQRGICKAKGKKIIK